MTDDQVEKTEFHVVVVRVGPVQKHQGADTLGVTEVTGYPVIVKLGDLVEGDVAVYFPVDSVVPTSHPAFAFLKTKDDQVTARIRARRLRGVFSMGLLVPVSVFPELSSAKFGDEVAELLGVTKHLSNEEKRLVSLEARGERQARAKRAGGFKMPVYGLDPVRKYESLIAGQEVVVTEKVHGSNCRYVYHKGRLWVGSHKVMRGATRSRLGEFFERLKLRSLSLLGVRHRAHTLANVGDVWWQVAEELDLAGKLKHHPDVILYGEVYGDGVQDLQYDCAPGQRRFRAFDAFDLKTRTFLPHYRFLEFLSDIGLDPARDAVPVLEVCVWDEATAKWWKERADTMKSTLNGAQLAEGIVVKALVERPVDLAPRAALKYVGQGYLLRKEG